MSRLWPQSLLGQLLLSVALALLVAQVLGATLVYRARAERLEEGMLNAAAFRLMTEMRGVPPLREMRGERPPWRRGMRRVQVTRTETSPLRTGEKPDAAAAAKLVDILGYQGIDPRHAVVVRRTVAADPLAREAAMRRAAFRPGRDPLDGEVIVAGVDLGPAEGWVTARMRVPPDRREGLWTIALQTLLIYAILMTVIALVARRITRPIASLTSRLERFAETRDPQGQIEPHGPADVRRLIEAHNAMEGRIAALLDEKDVMLGAIGHDLKTPLAALRVRIESVDDEHERSRMTATIEDITRSLDDILSLARVGRPSDPEERTELSALVASVVEEYEDMGERVSFAESTRIVATLRPTWLRRALRNLVGNALRYGGQARVSLERAGGSAAIRIEDDGPGIPDGEIERMMDPFTRGDPSRNTGTGGAGLGLALARAIAEQHGGSLELANRRDAAGNVSGLVATLRLPVQAT